MRARLPIILGLVAVLVLTAAFYFLLWSPRAQEQVDLEEEIANLEARQVQLNNEIRNLEEIQANELQIRAALARLEDFIPTGVAQPTAIRQFQLAADAAGVEILTITFGAPTVIEGGPDTGDPMLALGAIPVTMVTEGGYFQQVDLFRRLEVDVPRAVLISSVTMGAGQQGFPLLSTTWSGRLFALVPSGTPPPPPEDEADEDADEDTESGEEDAA